LGVDAGHVFRLSWGLEISGQVAGLDEQVPTTIVIRAVHRGDPEETGTLTGFIERRAECDAEGRFVLTRLWGTPRTTYELHAGVSKNGLHWSSSETVTAHPGDDDVRIALTPTASLEF